MDDDPFNIKLFLLELGVGGVVGLKEDFWLGHVFRMYLCKKSVFSYA